MERRINTVLFWSTAILAIMFLMICGFGILKI